MKTVSMNVLSIRHKTKAALLSAAATAAFATPAYSQESENADGATAQQNGENIIIVSARKRDEDVQAIPLAIDVVSGDDLDERGVADLRDLANLLPSVTFDRGTAQGDIRPAIRGLQAETGRTSVGILIDGVDVTSEALVTAGGGFLANQRLLDVQRIEVVKGPQSALYGRSAFGGAINYITRRPDFDGLEFRASAEATSEEGFELRGAVGTPVVDDVLAVRVNGYWWDERGSFRNVLSNEFIGGGDGYGINGAVLFKPVENLSLYGSLSYSKDNFQPRAIFQNSGNTTITLNADAALVTGRTTVDIFTGPLQAADVVLDLDPRTGRDYPGATSPKFRAALISELDLDGIDIVSMTAFTRVKFTALEDGDSSSPLAGQPYTGAFFEGNRRNVTEQFSQELRIQSNSDSPFQWAVGGLYWKETADQMDQGVNGTGFGPLTREIYDAFFLDIEANVPPRLFSRDTEHFSLFGFAELAITDRLSVSFEGRYSDETIDYFTDASPGTNVPYPFFQGVIPLGPPGAFVTAPILEFDALDTDRIEESFFLPRAAISFQAADNINLYASVGKGVKPGGNSTGAIIEFDESTSFDRETLWAYEVGMKSEWWDNRFLLNTSFFYQRYSDQQVSSQIIDPNTNLLRSVIENAGRSVIWGIELESRLKATDNLSFSAAYTYLNAEFKEFSLLSTSRNRIAEAGNCVLEAPAPAPAVCRLDRAGNRPADLPKHRFVGQVNFVEQLNDDWDFFANGTFSYNSSEFAETSNVIIQESATNIDADIGIDNGVFRISAFVRNLTKEDAITDANGGVDYRAGFAPIGRGFLPDPRTWGIRVNVTY